IVIYEPDAHVRREGLRRPGSYFNSATRDCGHFNIIGNIHKNSFVEPSFSNANTPCSRSYELKKQSISVSRRDFMRVTNQERRIETQEKRCAAWRELFTMWKIVRTV